jgi:hypothetical protein
LLSISLGWLVCCFDSQEEGTQSDSNKLSANKLFKKVPVDPKIMNYLRLYDLGREVTKGRPSTPKPNMKAELVLTLPLIFKPKFYLSSI